MKSKVVVIAACLLGSAKLYAADQFDVVSMEKNTASQTVWRITQPNVKQASTNYPQIKFLPGDSVSVDAGGCVQTGGHGATWKRYVDPSGPNSDKLYHGKIWIPGLSGSLVRIKDFAAFKVAKQISSPPPGGVSSGDLYLRLGYEDDGYGDNGYYSHDDGTSNQCKNSVNAFVIISIGHAGNTATDPTQFVGISPNNFRCQAGWSFANFPTAKLSQSSFDNAFNLSDWDYLDPTVEITYLAARGMASGGNCAGMSLLADVGEDQFVVGALTENFWTNYKTASASIITDINTAHWKQLSVAFLNSYIGSVFNSPSQTAAAIERDLTKANYNYGILAIEFKGEGHALVPLRVNHVGSQIQIDVYDSNRPCSTNADPNSYPKVIVNGNSWSYAMLNEGTWSNGSGAITGFSGFGYVPYLGDDGWSDLGTSLGGLVQVVFGNGVNVEQVTDGTGKRLFVPNQANTVDTSSQGLGNTLIRVPRLAASQTRPRSKGSKFPLTHPVNLTPAMAAQVQQIQSEYAPDYDGSGQVFLAKSNQLSSLTFTVSGSKANQPVRMLVGQKGNQFYEVNSVAAGAAAAHSTMTIHNVGNLADGVSVQSTNKAQLKVSVAHGLVSSTAKTITVQKTGVMTISSDAAKFSLTADKKLQLLSNAPLGNVTVSTQMVDKAAAVSSAPSRTMAPQKLQ